MSRTPQQSVFYYVHNREVSIGLYTDGQCTDKYRVAIPSRLQSKKAIALYAVAEAELFAFRHSLAAWQVHEEEGDE